jgi:hypothetical protein
MTSEEFHALVEQHTYELGDDDENGPLTLAQLARLERQKGIRFPAFYKEFLSVYGAGEFGSVDVLSTPKVVFRSGKPLRDLRTESATLWGWSRWIRITTAFL